MHAENDDDQRAIAAMTAALRRNPDDREVLLSLSVSHTNELDADEALGYMASWLRKNARYAHLAPPLDAPALDPVTLMRAFQAAATLAPDDADVHAVVGVLCNLSRDYDAAIDAFQRALALRPADYSLWNKLGATQANSARSVEALGAYRRALDLKPNYVRAWCNMGIGYANQGAYEESCAFYVRALSLNPRAHTVWGYLRMSAVCSGHDDAAAAVDAHDLQSLSRMFPL